MRSNFVLLTNVKYSGYLNNVLAYFLLHFIAERLNKWRGTSRVSHSKVARRSWVTNNNIALNTKWQTKTCFEKIYQSLISSWGFTELLNWTLVPDSSLSRALHIKSSPRQNCARTNFGIATNSRFVISGSSSFMNWISPSENWILK